VWPDEFVKQSPDMKPKAFLPKVQASSVFFKNDFSVWPVSQNFPQSSHPDALRQESFKFHRSQDFDFGFQSSDFFISISFGRLLLFALTLL
jgi:hypothetical protein